MKIGRLVINVRLEPRPLKAQAKPIYRGLICDICGEQIKGGTKRTHFRMAHPEYRFRMKRYDNSWGVLGNAATICEVCGVVTGGFAGLVKHYETFHPQLLIESEETWQPQVQT